MFLFCRLSDVLLVGNWRRFAKTCKDLGVRIWGFGLGFWGLGLRFDLFKPQLRVSNPKDCIVFIS